MARTRQTWKTGRYGGTGRTTRTRSTRTTRGSNYGAGRFAAWQAEIQRRICSFRTIGQQFSGGRPATGFTPTTASRWIKLVQRGCYVYQFTDGQCARFFGARWNPTTSSAVLRQFRQKFGSSIKAVTRGRNGTWLVAATPNCTARPFTSYTWK